MLIHYRRADCTRFRTPPIDTGAVQRQIERMFLDAWQRGMSARDVYREVLSSADITATLTAQVAPNLAFQRAVEVQSITAEVEAERAAYGRQREQTLAVVQERTGQDAEAARQQYEAIQSVKGERAAGYTATAARLEELRERVSRRIAEIGGVEGYHALLEIHGVVTGKPDTSKSAVSGYAGSAVPPSPSTSPEIAKSTPDPVYTPLTVLPATPSPSLEQRVAHAPTSQRIAKRRSFLQYLKSIFFR